MHSRTVTHCQTVASISPPAEMLVLTLAFNCGRGCCFCRGGDYERAIGGKTIAAGLTIRVTPTDDLAAPPEVDVAEDVEAELVKDEVS